MSKYYSDEKNVLIVLSLLKKHNIRKIIASPGATNVTLVASIQSDPFFQVFSSVDERSAAYMACGLAAETGETVVLTCTGATASRNYLPGLTEAFYRKLPILAITSTQNLARVGHNMPQVIDRSVMPKDTVKYSTTLPVISDEETKWECVTKVNNAILELNRNGGGPVHLNLPTSYCMTYTTQKLPEINKIERFFITDSLPNLPDCKIAVFIGSHRNFSLEEIHSIEKFCRLNDSVVFCDHTSGYYGKYKVNFTLAASQLAGIKETTRPEIVIHIGEVSGDYYTPNIFGKEIWRVSEDGELKDTFKKLKYIFQMSVSEFFSYYSYGEESDTQTFYYDICISHKKSIANKIPDIPFSNIWLALKIASKIPTDSSIHFGILNSLRSWNFFDLPNQVTSYCNVGGFGIDGCVSSLIGASLANREKLYFGIVGDLAFFYDMNSIGNRHLASNIRLIVVNNGKGTEFRQYNHAANQHGEDADQFIAATGHFGNQSPKLIKDYGSNLGFEYLAAHNKEEFIKVSDKFLSSKIENKPILLEIFTKSEDESKALEIMMTIESNIKSTTKQVAKNLLGEKSMNLLKKAIRK